MPAPLKDDFAASLNGTPLRFHWGMSELIDMQEGLTTYTIDAKTGKTVAHVPTIEEMEAGVMAWRLRYQRAMFWAGLQKYHPQMSVATVTDLMQKATPEEWQAVLNAFGYFVAPDPADIAALPMSENPPEAQAAPMTSGEDSTPAPDASA